MEANIYCNKYYTNSNNKEKVTVSPAAIDNVYANIKRENVAV